MLRAALKSLLSRKTRLLLSGIAVILGVAFITGTLVLNASLGDSIRSMFATAYQNVDVQVSAGSDDNGSPKPVPASLVDTVKDADHVTKVTGDITNANGGVQVLDKHGKVLPPTGAPTIGSNWSGVQSPMQLRDGAGPKHGNEIAINAAMSDDLGYKVGDTVKVIVGDPKPQKFKVVGIFGYTGDRKSLGGEKSVSFTTSEAQKLLLDGKDAYTDISVRGDGKVSQTELKKQIAGIVDDKYDVKTGKKLADEAAGGLQVVIKFFNYLLLGFGAIALLVSVFLIINTFSIIVAQRTRELALFRAIGAGRGQVTRSVMLEAFIVGFISAVIGLALGVGLGYGGTSAAAGLFGNMRTTLNVPTTAFIAALVIGVGITMFAAILPARRAGRIPPIAALRDAANTERPVRWFGIIGGVLLLGGGGLLTAALTKQFGSATSNDTLLAVFGGIILLFLGATIFTPFVARPLVSAIGALFSWSLPGKLGRRNSARNPRRTAITATALMIGIALVTAVGVLFSSAEASVTKYLNKQSQVDLLISGVQTGPTPPTFDKTVATKAADIDGVKTMVSTYADTSTTVGREGTMVDATDQVKDLVHMTAMGHDKGNTSSLGTDDIIVSKDAAKRQHVTVGDTLKVKFPKSKQSKELTVSGIVKNSGMTAPYIVSVDNAKYFAVDQPTTAYIKLDAGANKKTVTHKLDDLLKDNPLVSVSDLSVLVDQMTKQFDIMLIAVQVLLGMAMLIAIIGVINTLTLSIRERTRELGLLRATGLTRGQVTRMVTVESIVISMFGALLGLGVGAGLGVAVQQALKGDFVDVLAMPWGTMVFYVIASLVIGFFAALIPAYRANRLNVLNAISYE
ncbi:MAG TPA: FtsX-like permease family protein [Stackebrandtia sp.]|jgi:putative ABC transport system permease protein|uniref:ABC transporter permease n=1 Tax=Stackebrandtia sp. TaxID=2023065 RepID=UPI002D687389|nr:FtsX-like permease family protein [Stackebrandtia sp.]HZE42125.1 FtsX-like permease family protein [Stackebrandtia sp.]